jgi:hypothetical protein
LAESGIGVSTICPGVAHTNIIGSTQFSGVSVATETEKQQKFDRLYKKRNYTPDKVADRIVVAVAKKKSIVPVTPEAHVVYHSRRFLPALGRWLAARKRHHPIMAFKVTVSPNLIGGDVDEGYGKVADAFRRNMVSGQEVGAAVAVYRDGIKVVDLWGGYRNGTTKAPWEEDTLVNMFSTTKGVSALAIAVAVARGLISYDAAVADYWPEFAQASKGSITVRQLLSHQAGLPAIDAPLTLHDLADRAKLSAALAAQAPRGPPGPDTATTPSRLVGTNPN